MALYGLPSKALLISVPSTPRSTSSSEDGRKKAAPRKRVGGPRSKTGCITCRYVLHPYGGPSLQRSHIHVHLRRTRPCPSRVVMKQIFLLSTRRAVRIVPCCSAQELRHIIPKALSGLRCRGLLLMNTPLLFSTSSIDLSHCPCHSLTNPISARPLVCPMPQRSTISNPQVLHECKEHLAA